MGYGTCTPLHLTVPLAHRRGTSRCTGRHRLPTIYKDTDAKLA